MWLLASPVIVYLAGKIFQHILYVIDYIDIVYAPFGLMVVLIFLSIWFLKILDQLKWAHMVIAFILIWMPIDALATYIARDYIANMAMKKYHKKPEYIEIEFGYEFRRPHAILLKEGKAYYWSFSQRDFIEDQKIRRWL